MAVIIAMTNVLCALAMCWIRQFFDAFVVMHVGVCLVFEIIGILFFGGWVGCEIGGDLFLG